MLAGEPGLWREIPANLQGQVALEVMGTDMCVGRVRNAAVTHLPAAAAAAPRERTHRAGLPRTRLTRSSAAAGAVDPT